MSTTWTRLFKVLTLCAAAVAVIGGCCLAATPDPGLDTVTDVIVGRGGKGPYVLSYTEIDPKSVMIIVAGRTLRRDEYSIDLPRGILWFSANLLQDVTARVSYKTTAKSKPTTEASSIPITFDVFGSDRSKLQITGTHVATDPKKPDSGRTVVGVVGQQSWGQSKLTSRVLMSDDSSGRPTDASGQGDRSAVDIAGETRIGALTFKGSYLTAGSKFAGQKEYGIMAGREQSDFSLTFAPNKRIEAVATRKAVEDTVGQNKGTTTVVEEQKLVMSPTDATRVSLVHSTTETSNAATGAQNTAKTEAVIVEQQIASTTSAAVKLTNTERKANSTSETVTTREAVVASKPSDKLDVTAKVVQKSSDVRGDEVNTAASVRLKPMENVAVEASHARTESDTTGLATDTSIALKASAPGNTEIKGAFAEKTTADKLQYQRNISVTSSPWRYARVSAMFSQKGINEQDDVTKGALLELTPFSHTKIAGGYKHIQTGSRVMSITDISASSKPVNYLEISGSYRDREARQDEAPDSAEVQVALAPFNFFTLRGSYKANPENVKGEIEKYEASTAGVKLKVGSVGVTADVSRKEEYLLGRQSEEMAVGLEIPAFGRGKLTTGYKVAQYFGGSGLSSSTYSLGYRRDLGSLFNLSLTGYYTRYRETSSISGKNDYSAEAAIGIRF